MSNHGGGSEAGHVDRAKRLVRDSRWAFVASGLCAILAAIDLQRYLTHGVIVVGRESQRLTGFGAQIVIGAALFGALGFLVWGIRKRRRATRIERGAS